ncbi:MAG: hypothetical protein AB7I38_06575 [Dehalococcoidia bacterium]
MLAHDRRLIGAIALFALLACAYGWSVGLRATRGASITADEPFYLLTTQSLIEDGNLDLTGQYARESWRSFFDHPDGLWKQSVPGDDGRLLSPHEPGLSIFLVPGFGIGGLAGAQVQMLLLTAATFALGFVLVASETRAALVSWLATAAVGLTATAFVYATEIYPEAPAALLLVLSLLLARRPRLGAWHGIAMAGVLTALAWFGMKYVPLGCLVGVYFLWRAEGRGRATLLGASVLSGAAYVWLHLAIYGALTAYNGNTVFEGAATTEVVRAHLGFGTRVYRLWGLFIDERFGVGRWAPVLLPVLPALPLLLRRGSLGALALGLIATQMAIATFVAITMMGWWFPGRTLMAVFPLFAFVLAELALRLPRAGRIVLGGLGIVSLVFVAGLTQAARGGEVTLAVDPFEMSSTAFRATAALFPDYRTWTDGTVARTAAWLAAGGALAVWLQRDAMRAGIERARGLASRGPKASRRLGRGEGTEAVR